MSGRFCHHARSVHHPDRIITGDAIAPDEVCLPVSVEISESHDSPVGGHESPRERRAQDRRSIHEPDHMGARGFVPPEQIEMLIAVEVSYAHNPEVRVRYGWADYPTGNLWNQAGLPASPFRTDRE